MIFVLEPILCESTRHGYSYHSFSHINNGRFPEPRNEARARDVDLELSENGLPDVFSIHGRGVADKEIAVGGFPGGYRMVWRGKNLCKKMHRADGWMTAFRPPHDAVQTIYHGSRFENLKISAKMFITCS